MSKLIFNVWINSYCVPTAVVCAEQHHQNLNTFDWPCQVGSEVSVTANILIMMAVVVCVQTHSCRDAYVEVRGQLWGLGLSFHCGFQGPNSGRQACSTSLLPTKSSHCPHKTFLKHASTYSCNNHAHLHPNLLFILFGKMIVKTGLGPAQACGDTLKCTIWYSRGKGLGISDAKDARGF